MRFHGLVFLALLGFSTSISAQTDSADSLPNRMPPIPTNDDLMPSVTTPSNVELPANVGVELEQFRNELRQFQLLHEELARGVKSTDAESERIAIQQRQELLDLMSKLARNGAARKAARVQKAKPAAPADDSTFLDQPSTSQVMVDPAETSSTQQPTVIDATIPLESADIADAFALGKVLFNKGEFANAEKVLRKAKVDPENEMTLKYLIATCLRRQSKWRPAMQMYKAIADSDQDPILKKLAKWQLDNIRWQQESESQLQQLQKQREKRLELNKSAATPTDDATQ